MALLIAVCATSAPAGERRPAPGLPLAQWWSVAIDGAVNVGPVSDGARIYVALSSAHLTARDAKDGHELWRQNRAVTSQMAVDQDLLFVASADAIEALNGASGKTVWTLPRTTPAAPLLAQTGVLIVVTDADVIAVRAATGQEVWRRQAGGVKLPPALDGDRLYTGAGDGRVLALNLKDGSVVWEQFLSGGVTAIAAHHGRVYAGAGDKLFYCLDGKKGERRWAFKLGALAVGHVAVDDTLVYVASLNNVVWALDREGGNQRWQVGLRQRPSPGVYVAGHVAFAPVASTELPMLYDGRSAGLLGLPGEGLATALPSIRETPDGTIVYTVTGSLANEWNLTKFAPAGEAALIPFPTLEKTPGVPYLTDPALAPLGNVLQTLLLGDPPLLPLADVGWPIVLRDPPLVPLTTLPGVQLRPLSPVPPVRRGARGPGG